MFKVHGFDFQCCAHKIDCFKICFKQNLKTPNFLPMADTICYAASLGSSYLNSVRIPDIGEAELERVLQVGPGDVDVVKRIVSVTTQHITVISSSKFIADFDH